MKISYEYINRIDNDQLFLIKKLVKVTFEDFFAAHCSDKGKKSFFKYTSTDNLTSLIENKEIFIIAMYKGEVIGLLCSARNKSHISLFFVEKNFQNMGIATELFKRFMFEIKDENFKIITLNSLPNTENIYIKMGFMKIGPSEIKEGIRSIPMAYEIKEL